MGTSVKVPVKTKARPGSARTYRAQPRWPFLWILPAFLIYFVFKLAPMIAGFYLALLKWDGINPAKFIGLQNFTQMIGDPVIGQALLHNALYAAGTVVGLDRGGELAGAEVADGGDELLLVRGQRQVQHLPGYYTTWPVGRIHSGRPHASLEPPPCRE